jgi:hypothetical protein
VVLSGLRCCSSQECEGSCCRDAEKAGRCGGGWKEGGKERGGGLCSREAMAAVSGEGRVKGQEDVLWWEEMGKEVLCVVCLTVAIG